VDDMNTGEDQHFMVDVDDMKTGEDQHFMVDVDETFEDLMRS